MSELIIHIGSHKTGTTSIQQACQKHLESSGGTKYIDVRTGENRVVRTRGRLEKFRAEVDLEQADKIFRSDRRGKLQSRPKRLVCSAEAFFWISKPDSVNAFAELLRQRFEKITVISYLRRQDLLAVSHRKQVATPKMPAARFYGISPLPLPEFQPHFMKYFDYAAKLSDIWANAFGKENIIVVPFERNQLDGGDVVIDFAKRIGVSFSFKEPLRANAALEGDRLIAGLILAQSNVPPKKLQKIIRSLPGSGTFLPTRTEARTFLDHFAEANSRLSEQWTWKGSPFRFDSSLDMYPEERMPQWTQDQLAEILQALVGGIKARQASND